MIKYSTSPIDETYTRIHIFLKSHFFFTRIDLPSVPLNETANVLKTLRRMVEDPVQTTRVKKCAKKRGQLRVDMTSSLWEECSRNQQQRNKWIGALIGLKVNILMLNRLKTFFNEVFFFPSDVKISFSLFQKP